MRKCGMSARRCPVPPGNKSRPKANNEVFFLKSSTKRGYKNVKGDLNCIFDPWQNVGLVGSCCLGQKLPIIKLNKSLNNAYLKRLFVAYERQTLIMVSINLKYFCTCCSTTEVRMFQRFLFVYLLYRAKNFSRNIENRNAITNTPANVHKFSFCRISACFFAFTYFEMS